FYDFIKKFVEPNHDLQNSEIPNWFDNYVKKSVESDPNLLNTLVATVYTSVGQAISIKPERNLTDKLRQIQNNMRSKRNLDVAKQA
ncbi:MAG: hypothetical protein WCE88_08555, partial [Burkholderiales bacterium]